MLIVSGHLLFTGAADRDRIIAASVPFQEATRAWPGCIAYCFSPDPVDDRRIQIYEAWSDGDALRAHFTHDDYAGMRALLNSGGRDRSQTDGYPRIRLVEQEMDVYDTERRPNTSYFGG